MNIKGFLFLILSITVLLVTIYFSASKGHYLLTFPAHFTFSDRVTLNNHFIVLDDTTVYLKLDNPDDTVDITVEITGPGGTVYSNEPGQNKKPEKLALQKGTYTLHIEGRNGSETRIQFDMGYYTDEVRFLKEE